MVEGHLVLMLAGWALSQAGSLLQGWAISYSPPKPANHGNTMLPLCPL
jgi:hypothetical protein